MGERLFEVWTDAPVPPGLADRVLARIDAPGAASGEANAAPARSPRARRRCARVVAVVVAVGAAVAAAVASSVWDTPAGRPVTPDVAVHSVASRETLHLAERAVVVVEPEAVLGWSWRDEHVVVEQRAGRAFYRVTSGGAVRVVTPAGDLDVAGTCFHVEVVPMKRSLIAAGIGAGAAALVTISIYEGVVRARNDGGEVTATAGETIAMRSGAAPTRAPTAGAGAARGPSATDDPALPAPTTAREQLFTRRIEVLGRRVNELEAEVNALRDHDEAREQGRPPDDAFFDLSDAELAWLARECEIRYDVPGYALSADAGAFARKLAERAEMSPAETEALVSAIEQGHPGLIEQMRALYIEVTGDAAGAESLSPRNLQHEVFEKSRPEDLSEALRRLSAERAGLAQPPANLASRPAVERLLRLLTASGELLENTLATSLGPERARQLRKEGVGWGRRRQSGCPGE